MSYFKSVFRVSRILSDDDRISITHLLVWLWLLRLAVYKSLDMYAVGLGALVLFFWGFDLLVELFRQKRLTDSERDSIENLSNRLSMIESSIALNEQRRMF